MGAVLCARIWLRRGSAFNGHLPEFDLATDIATAQRLDLGGVDVSVARLAAGDGPPSAGPTTDYMRAEPNRSITHFVTKSFQDNI